MAILHWNDVEERQLNDIIRGRIVKTNTVMACRITAKAGNPNQNAHPRVRSDNPHDPGEG